MSPDKQPGQLPLPKPRSPEDLDTTILGYAREHAPRRRRFIPNAWMSGLAAAGIAGVALLITLPQTPLQQQDDLLTSDIAGANVERAELGSHAPVPAQPEQLESVATTQPAAPVSLKQKENAQFAREALSDQWSDNTLSAPLASSADTPQSSSMDRARITPDVAEIRAPRSLEEANVSVKIAPTAEPESIAAATDKEHSGGRFDALHGLKAVPAAKQATASENADSKTPVERALYECRAFLNTKKQPPDTDAEDCYTEFRAACTDCALPETLQEALDIAASKRTANKEPE